MSENLLRTYARAMRREPSDAEAKLWRALRGGRIGGCKFRRQEQIGPYIVDFVCYEHRLVVELDGSQHAGSTRDERRDAWLRSRGLDVLRFWNHDVLTNMGGVLFAVAAKLRLDWQP
jgi:very-short-patch-repair endonuclease